MYNNIIIVAILFLAKFRPKYASLAVQCTRVKLIHASAACHLANNVLVYSYLNTRNTQFFIVRNLNCKNAHLALPQEPGYKGEDV